MNRISKAIMQIGIVPVIKLVQPERDAKLLAQALCAGDIAVAEVTFRAKGADTAIRLMKEACPNMIIGAALRKSMTQFFRRILMMWDILMVLTSLTGELI